MRIGLVGAGHIAQVHVDAIRDLSEAEIVAVADIFPNYADQLARARDIPSSFTDARKMIEETQPDAVHVTTPPATHHEVALECLKLGCHVLVEKPMALTPSEAEEMVKAAEQNEVLLSVNHNCYFESTVQRARKLIREGAIGEVISAEVDYGFDLNRYPAITREGATESHWAYTQLHGGPLQDQVPHPLSLIVGHLGEVEEVTTQSSNRGLLPEPWADEIRVMLQGAEAQAEVYCSFCYKPDAMIFTVRGTEGTIVADMYSMTCTVDRQSSLPRGARRLLSGFRRGIQEVEGAINNLFRVATGRFDQTNGVGPLIERFHDAVREGTEPPVTPEEGKEVVDLIHQIWPEPIRPVRERSGPGIREASGSADVLVTGGTGFVGSHLVEELGDRGRSVRVLARPSSSGLGLLKKIREDVEVVTGDLADSGSVQQAMEGIQTVYHVGGAMGGGWETNQAATVTGTENVIQVAKEANPRRVVYYSSLVVYDVLSLRNGETVTEDAPLHGDPKDFGPYPWGKVTAEEIVQQAHEKDDIPTTIIRPGIIIGPRGPVFFPHLGFQLGDQVFIMLRGGQLELPLVYVDNLVDGTIAAAHSDEAVGQAYNLVDDGSVTVKDYLQRFSERTGLDTTIISVPFALPHLAAGAYELAAGVGLMEPGKTSRKRMRWKHKQVTYSNEAAKHDFGYESSVPLDEALNRTFGWYMENRR